MDWHCIALCVYIPLTSPLAHREAKMKKEADKAVRLHTAPSPTPRRRAVDGACGTAHTVRWRRRRRLRENGRGNPL
jgi:hypothetical protein